MLWNTIDLNLNQKLTERFLNSWQQDRPFYKIKIKDYIL